MKRLVLDAGVVASWFDHDGTGRHLREEYEAGTLAVVGPPQLPDDVLEHLRPVAEERLARIGSELRRLGFELQQPPVADVAHWIAHGLASHRAAYAALASHLDLTLATDDPELLSATPSARSPDRC